MTHLLRFSRIQSVAMAAALALGLQSIGAAKVADDGEVTPDSTSASASGKHVPLLWKVSDDDNSIYLLGSFHMLKPTDYPLSTDIDAALNDANSVMFEIDMDSAATPETMALMMEYQMLGDGRTLSNVLPEETRRKLEAMLKMSSTTLAQVDPMDPWALSMGMAIGVMQGLGFTPEAGVDIHLTSRAKALGKTMLALETIEEQFRTMDSQPMSEQIFGLDDFLSNPQEAVSQLQDMHESWLTGDADRIETGMKSEMREETPETYRIMLVDRNNAWMPQLQALLDERGSQDNTLVVVGALHVIGADGVVELLRAKGYRIERICSACAAVDA